MYALLIAVFITGCSSTPQKAVDERVLSCIEKPKEEVCQILGLKGDEYFEGEGPGPYDKALSLEKEINWCGKKLDTFIGFNKEKDGICSLISAKQTVGKTDSEYMKNCLAQLESQFGSPEKVIIGSSAEAYEAGKLEDYFSGVEKDGLGFRFHKDNSYVEVDFKVNSTDADEISIQFLVTWDPARQD